jgi:hypothetical protein
MHTSEVDWASGLSLGVSVVSLAVVIVIGRKTIRVGQDSVKVGQDSVEIAKRSVQVSESAREAAETASRRDVADSKMRRLEAMLDVILDMRQVFNAWNRISGDREPAYNSPDAHGRLALCRTLEGRLVPLEDDFDEQTMTRYLARSSGAWTSGQLETAILEVKTRLAAATKSI